MRNDDGFLLYFFNIHLIIFFTFIFYTVLHSKHRPFRVAKPTARGEPLGIFEYVIRELYCKAGIETRISSVIKGKTYITPKYELTV